MSQISGASGYSNAYPSRNEQVKVSRSTSREQPPEPEPPDDPQPPEEANQDLPSDESAQYDNSSSVDYEA